MANCRGIWRWLYHGKWEQSFSDVEKDALRNVLVNAFSSAKKVQEFYKGCFYMDINSVFIFKTEEK